MKLEWSQEAIDNLNSIYDYYFIKSPTVARHIYNLIIDEAERLSANPLIGVIIKEISDKEIKFRSLVVVRGIFKIIYIVQEDNIYIYRIWDCRQHPKKLKDKR
ncbi:type II toxin-antitoxin system RelE/ParE family toxin [Dysgonomonas sp. 521]|uniref:type II toxin-antitoxin system RelE/ParE family toxin n=1 Tax=Dysgonomonas sp. 521 TaxID=2302932 RepID=UPI0013D1803C|nr:type II toxin-antitoxin system RelE/ParE family toxin [Dysgonomonas sp. 521]NDV96101.1 type II toxin-antitoxin system RelE/ParE family toxin [Dysgonomonas sp. 521]